MPNESQYRSLRLDKLVRLNYGKSPKELNFGSGVIPVVGTGNEVRFADKSLVSHASIVIARKGTLSKPVFLETPFWPIDTTFYLSHFKGVLPKFLFYSLSTVDFASLNESTGVPSLSRDTLYRIELQIPDLKRQEYVIKVISDVDTLIAQVESVIAKHERLRAGMLHDLFTHGVDQQGRLRSEEIHKFKNSPLGRIPVEWKVVTLEELGKWQGGLTPSKKRSDYWHNGRHLWISPKDIERGSISNSEDRISDEAVKYLKIFPANRNIIVVFRSGVLRHSFPVCYCTKPFSVNQDLKVLVPKPGIEAQFVFLTLQQYEPLIVSRIVKHGTTVESIDAEAFYALQVPLPTQDEQKLILGVVGNCDGKIKNLRSRLQKLNRLKTGLMHDLLTQPMAQASAASAVLQEAEALFA